MAKRWLERTLRGLGMSKMTFLERFAPSFHKSLGRPEIWQARGRRHRPD